MSTNHPKMFINTLDKKRLISKELNEKSYTGRKCDMKMQQFSCHGSTNE